MATKPWSERIPAAVARGPELLDTRPERMFLVESNGPYSHYITLTAGEGALAQALWWEMSRTMDSMNGTERAAFIEGFRGASIRAFTEKIERIESHGH